MYSIHFLLVSHTFLLRYVSVTDGLLRWERVFVSFWAPSHSISTNQIQGLIKGWYPLAVSLNETLRCYILFTYKVCMKWVIFSVWNGLQSFGLDTYMPTNQGLDSFWNRLPAPLMWTESRWQLDDFTHFIQSVHKFCT